MSIASAALKKSYSFEEREYILRMQILMMSLVRRSCLKLVCDLFPVSSATLVSRLTDDNYERTTMYRVNCATARFPKVLQLY